jgi:hypothetical protein
MLNCHSGASLALLNRREAVPRDTPRVSTKADIGRWRPSASSRLHTRAVCWNGRREAKLPN